MRIVFLVLVFFLSCSGINAQDIYLRLGVRDCINCNANLASLRQTIAKEKIFIVIPESYAADSTELLSLYGLSGFNATVIYSDSLFNKYDSGVESYLYIIKDKELTYKSQLKTLKMDDLTRQLGTGRSLCLEQNGNAAEYYLFDAGSMLTFRRSLGKYTYNDLQNHKTKVFFADDEWLKRTYQSYYGEKYEDPYKRQLEVIKSAPNAASRICDGKKINDSTLVFLVESLFEKKINDKDILMSREYFVQYVDVRTLEVGACVHIEKTKLPSGYIITKSGFFAKGSNLYLLIQEDSTKTDSRISVEFKYNSKQHKFIQSRILPAVIPGNYLTYHLMNNFHQLVSNGNIYTFRFGNVIYDVTNEKSYVIPLGADQYEGLDSLFQRSMQGKSPAYYFTIYDLRDGKDAYELLYRDLDGNLVTMKISKADAKVVGKSKVLNMKEIAATLQLEPKYYFSENKITYKEVKNNCFELSGFTY